MAEFVRANCCFRIFCADVFVALVRGTAFLGKFKIE